MGFGSAFGWEEGCMTEDAREAPREVDPAALEQVAEALASAGRLLHSYPQRDWGEALGDEPFDAVEADYMRLFVNGAPTLLAPPWESVYVNATPTLFQCSTMGVRAWYRRFGLEVENVNHEPDDHVGLELSFAAHLCAEAARRAREGDAQGARVALADASAFASEHLLAWAPHWCDVVSEHARTAFYRDLAAFAKQAMAQLAELLGIDVRQRVFR